MGDKLNVERVGEGAVVAAGRNATAILTHIENYIERELTGIEKKKQEEAYDAKRLAAGVRDWVRSIQRPIGEAPQTGNPYKGLLEYRLADAENFFGRGQAKSQLLNCLHRGPLTVIYSESGAGKTSLIQAGISPQLRDDGYLPVYLRPHDTDPSLKLKQAFIPSLQENEKLAQISLRDFLIRVGKVVGPKTKLFIFLDQFEEFFTNLEESVCQKFKRELTECVNDTNLAVAWLFSLREESFSKLDFFQPGIAPFENIYRLERLSRKEAQEAVVEPAARCGKTYEDGLVELIISDLGGDHVTPPEMQLVCSTLYEASVAERILTIEKYQNLGGAEKILGDYLEFVLSRSVRVEYRSIARGLMTRMIDSNKRRIMQTKNQLADYLAVINVVIEVLDPILNQLVESRLLCIRDSEAGGSYELAHDYLVDKIYADPRVFEIKAAQELLDKEVNDFNQNRAISQGKRQDFTLSDDKLSFIESHRKDLVINDSAKLLLKKSKGKIRRRRAALFGSVILIFFSVIAAFNIMLALQGAQKDLEIRFVKGGAVTVGSHPAALAFDGIRLWVANREDNTVQAIHSVTGLAEIPIPVGAKPSALAYDGRLLWIANQGDNSVQAIDLNKKRILLPFGIGAGKPPVIASIEIQGQPSALLYDGGRLWVSNVSGNTIHSINLTTGQVELTIQVGEKPGALAFDGQHLWVANRGDQNIQAIEPGTGAHITTIGTGKNPSALLFDGVRLWVANTDDNTVQAINPKTYDIEITIRAGVSEAPTSLAFDGRWLWVANSQFVQKLDIDGAVSGPPEAGIQGVANPSALLFDGSRLWIANSSAGTISSTLPEDLAAQVRPLVEPSFGGEIPPPPSP